MPPTSVSQTMLQQHGVLGWASYNLTRKATNKAGQLGLEGAKYLGRQSVPFAKTVGRTGYRATKAGASALYWKNMGAGVKVPRHSYLWANRTRLTKQYIKNPYARHIAPRAAMMGKTARFLSKTPIFSAAFVGYEISQGDNLAQGLMRGGVEAASITGGTLGAQIGAGIGTALIPIPVVGTVIGTAVGAIAGYTATRMAASLGLNTPKAPEFENVFMNRRALTMRQASMMHMAKTSRSAFGNEAQMMHLR